MTTIFSKGNHIMILDYSALPLLIVSVLILSVPIAYCVSRIFDELFERSRANEEAKERENYHDGHIE